MGDSGSYNLSDCCVCFQTKLSEFMDSLAIDHLPELAEQSTQEQLVDIAQGHSSYTILSRTLCWVTSSKALKRWTC